MKQSDGLFQLINSLSATEKRYFRLFAQRHVLGERNDYLLLFDVLVLQADRDEYDEALIKKQLKAKGCKTILRTTKNYLHGLILRSMRQYAEESDVNRQLQARLSDIYFLLEKGLLSKATELLRKAQKIARLYEKNLYLLQFSSIERRVMRLSQNKHTLKKLMQIEHEEDRVLKQIREEAEMLHFYDRVFLLIRSGLVQEKRTKAVEQYLRDPLLQENRMRKNFSSEVLRLQCLSDLSLLHGDNKQSRSALRRLINLYDRHPHQFRDEPLRYIKVLGNYLNSCYQLQRFDEFPSMLRRMKLLEHHSRATKFEVFRNGSFIELLYLMNTKKLEEGLELVPAIDTGIKQFGKKIPTARVLTLRFNVIVLLFLNSRFREALRWINQLRERDYPDVRRDIQHAARLFQLILQFELQHNDVVENGIRSTTRHLRKISRFGAFEQYLLDLLTALINEADARKQKKIFQNAHTTIQNAPEEQQKMLLFHEVRIWVESRATGKVLADVFRQ